MSDGIVFQKGRFYVALTPIQGRPVFSVYENGVTAAALRATFDLPPPSGMGRAIAKCEQLDAKARAGEA